MKLYTEFEIKFAMDIARCQPDKTFDEVLEELTPIQLPTDEEIDNEGWEYQVISGTGDDRFIHFREGAKWMRDEIQGGGK